jgi:hypothetical protein
MHVCGQALLRLDKGLLHKVRRIDAATHARVEPDLDHLPHTSAVELPKLV